MGWNRTLPSGSTPVNSSDNVIRDQWDYIRDAIRQEHADFDANPSAPSQIVHLQGSARVIVYTGATILDSSADVVAAVSQLYHDSRDIGRVIIDRNTTATPGAVWYCSAIDTFVELTRYWGNVVVGGTLGVTGDTTLTGALNANNGIVIPTTKQLRVPSGESSIYNGTNSLDPFAHAARHLFGGGDFLAGLIASNVILKSASGPTTSAGTLVTHTYDFSARGGNTLIVAIGWTQTEWDLNAGQIAQATIAIQLNDTDKSQVLDVQLNMAGGAAPVYNTQQFLSAAFLVTNASGQKIDLELKTLAGSADSKAFKNHGLLLVDLATVGLTT